MNKWKIEYADTISRGQVRTKYYEGNFSESEIIDFFGLEDSDVSYYKIEKIA